MKLLFPIIFIFIFLALSGADDYSDSLLNQLSKAETDKQKTAIYLELGKYWSRKSPDVAYDYVNKSLDLSKKNNDRENEINSYILFGIIHKNMGNFKEAVKHQMNGLKIAVEIKDKQKESACLNNLGSIYQAQNSYDKALEYFKESLVIEEEFGNKNQVSVRLYNIGTIYELKDSLDMAYTYYYNSLLIEQEIGNKEGIYFAYYGLAGVDTKRKDFARATEYLEKALVIAQQLNDLGGLALCHNELAKLYKAMGETDKAIQSFIISIDFARKINFRNEIKDGYLGLSQLYRLKNDYKTAFEYQQQYISINDSLNSVEISSKIAEIESRYRLDIKEKEIKFLEEKESLLEERADSEKANRYYLLFAFFLAIFLALTNLDRVLNNLQAIFIYSGLIVFTLLVITLIFFRVNFSGNDINLENFIIVLVDVLTYAILPIFIFVILAERILLTRHLRTAGMLSEKIREIDTSPNEPEIVLIAENDKDQVKCNSDDLLFIEANDNYSAVCYLVNGQMKKVLLRGSLKRMEDQLAGRDMIIRCHKSYIVNIRNIRKVAGNAQGYKLQFSQTDIEIPVSRNFPKSIMEKIRNQMVGH